MRLCKQQLVDLGASETRATAFLSAMNQQLPFNDIDTPRRVARFLSQAYHESTSLRLIEANLHYSAKALRAAIRKYYKTAQTAVTHHRKPSKIGSCVHANRTCNGDEASGDGWTCRGRGLIQLTGRNSCRAFSEFVGVECVETPHLLTDRYSVHSGVIFWTPAR